MVYQSGQTNSGPPRRFAGSGGAGGVLSMPDAALDNCLWVQTTDAVYAGDGSVQYPFTSIDAAVNAAVALAPTASNPVGVIIMPGEYEEVVELDVDYVYLFGWNRETTILWNAATALVITTELTGVFGLTVRGYGVNEVVDVNTAVYATRVEFNECTFEIIDSGDTGTGPFEVRGASGARFIDCAFTNTYTGNNTLVLAGGSVAELWDCTLEGVVVLEQVDDLYLYRCTIELGWIESDTTGALEIMDCRIVTTSGSAIRLGGSTQWGLYSDDTQRLVLVLSGG